MTHRERQKEAVARLVATATHILADLICREGDPEGDNLRKTHPETLNAFRDRYQHWYTETLELVTQLLPSRKDEFEAYYLPSPRRTELKLSNYCIQDFKLGLLIPRSVGYDRSDKERQLCLNKFSTQKQILESCAARFDSSVFEIRALLRADLFDSEMAAAEELLSHGFNRAAGAVAGVVLEKHLGEVCASRNVPILTKKPTLSTFYEALKNGQIIDQATWRFIQHLADIRNDCDHGTAPDPTSARITDLIHGVKKVIKTVN